MKKSNERNRLVYPHLLLSHMHLEGTAILIIERGKNEIY